MGMTSGEKWLMAGGAVGLWILLSGSKSSSGSGSIAPNMMGQYFSIDEFITCGSHGIDQQPSLDQWNAGKKLASYVLDPLRACLGDALTVNSWLRDDLCNDVSGGVSDSTHLTGGTADVKFMQDGRKKNWLIMRCLIMNELPFDRVLIEHGTLEDPSWIHIEYNPDLDPDDQRQQIWHIPSGTHGNQITWQQAENLYL